MARNSGNAAQSIGAVAPSGGAGVGRLSQGAVACQLGNCISWIIGKYRKKYTGFLAPRGMPFNNQLPLFMIGPMDTNFEIALIASSAGIQELVASADA